MVTSAYYLVWGPHGIAQYYFTNKRLTHEQQKIDALQNSIALLKNSIARTKESPFETEKVARYDLSLGYTNEVICVLPKRTSC